MKIQESQQKSIELETHNSTELQLSQSTIVNEGSGEPKISTTSTPDKLVEHESNRTHTGERQEDTTKSEEKPAKLVKVNEVDYDVTEEQPPYTGE